MRPAPLVLILPALGGCAHHRQPQPLSDFVTTGITLEIPPSTEEGALGGAFFEALLEREVPPTEVTLDPGPGLELTCRVRHHQLRVAVMAATDQLDASRYARAECSIGGVTVPITILW